jgi:hypothetical protein
MMLATSLRDAHFPWHLVLPFCTRPSKGPTVCVNGPPSFTALLLKYLKIGLLVIVPFGAFITLAFFLLLFASLCPVNIMLYKTLS